MRKLWKNEKDIKLRETGSFVSHPCLDCLKMIRWEGYLCWECDRKRKYELNGRLHDTGEHECPTCKGTLTRRGETGNTICQSCDSFVAKHGKRRGYKQPCS